MPVKPVHLRAGDCVGIVSPASAPPDPNAIDRCVQAVKRLGFTPRLAANARRRRGFLAGTDRQRAADLMSMFLDPKIKAILCVRGGYGTARLLPLLDYRAIRSHPKILVGYSDITSLHCGLFAKSGLVTFHGPMLHADFMHEKINEFTLRSFTKTLTQPIAPGGIRSGWKKRSVSILRSGKVTGPLIGGNLSILCTLLGTPFQPSFKKAILFFEDLDEKPYRFDRMLTHLLNAGLLQQVAGIAVGINKNCEDPKARQTKEYRQTVEDVLKERLTPLKVPVVVGLPFGHVPENATLPVGVRATLDGESGDLIITESGVTAPG